MPKQEAVLTASPRILKRSACPSLSGRSELTYHIGCDEAGLIHLQLASNTGAGKLNTDWVALTAIEALIGENSGCSSLNSAVLRHLFQGKSRNSPSFLLAVLLAEAIVRGCLNGDDGYQLGDIAEFRQTVVTLASMSSDPAIPSNTHAEASNRKRGGKGKA